MHRTEETGDYMEESKLKVHLKTIKKKLIWKALDMFIKLQMRILMSPLTKKRKVNDKNVICLSSSRGGEVKKDDI